ncbi:MAG: hypothetical protein P4L84_17885 [Isosphaeraceae bacterium]|nr:hypothetical protein [Isosphaeraceae bacterium]
MSSQASVQSVDALKEFRVALALFADDVLGALGGVEMEAKRTAQWLQHDRRTYWQDQIKRRREAVSQAQAEVFRRKLQKTADNTPAMSEQKEVLRRAEASLHEAELRAAQVKKWEPALQHAILEYHGSIRRIKDLASGDVPRAVFALERMIDALEAYFRVAPPSGAGGPSPLESIVDSILAAEASPSPCEVPEETSAAEAGTATSPDDALASAADPELPA